MLNENIPMYLFHQGTNAKAYEYLGSHRDEEDENFTFFRVWAPHAVAVFVACDKNEWTGEGFELKRINEQGLWEGHFEGFKDYDAYKYLIIAQDGRKLMKCDPLRIPRRDASRHRLEDLRARRVRVDGRRMAEKTPQEEYLQLPREYI